MKKFEIALLFLLTLLPGLCFAQNKQNGWQRVHAAKVAYISDRLQLGVDQATKFWPIYNEYEKERKAIRKKYLAVDGKNQQYLDESAARQNIEDNLDMQQDELDLKRKYKEQFLKVISAGQLADLMKAEREFRQLIMHRLKEHHKRFGMRP